MGALGLANSRVVVAMCGEGVLVLGKEWCGGRKGPEARPGSCQDLSPAVTHRRESLQQQFHTNIARRPRPCPAREAARGLCSQLSYSHPLSAPPCVRSLRTTGPAQPWATTSSRPLCAATKTTYVPSTLPPQISCALIDDRPLTAVLGSKCRVSPPQYRRFSVKGLHSAVMDPPGFESADL